MTMTEYLMVSKDEFEVRKWEIFMTPWEVEELLEYSDVFKKYLTKKINEIQAQLWLCTLQGKEWLAYQSIATLKWVIEWLDKTAETYKEFKKEKPIEKPKK